MDVKRIGMAAAAAALAAMAGGATAQTLPTLALDPAAEPSIWHGLSVGTEIVGVSGRGGGGVGADVFAGYDRAFANGIVLGVRGVTGYTPALYGRPLVRGYDFGGGEVRVGYDMGRLMPFVTAGVVLARPHFSAGFDAPGVGTLNGLLSNPGSTQRLTHVGAGVEFAVTPDLTVGLAVNAVQGNGLVLP